MKKLLSIVIACGAGGCIGTFIGVHFFGSLSILGYVVAVLSGGGIGYFLYDFEGVLKGIPHAWKKATTPKVKPTPTEAELLQRKRKKLLSSYLYLNVVDNQNFEVVGLMIFLLVVISLTPIHIKDIGACFWLMFVFSIGIYVISFGRTDHYVASYSDNGIEHEIRKRKRFLGITPKTPLLLQWLVINPIVLPFATLVCNYVSFLRAVKNEWSEITASCGKAIIWIICLPWLLLKFIWTLFKYVHGDRRLLCLCDSGLGTAIGMFYHSPIIGLIAGATSGLISYELISVRWLKLQLKH